MFITFEGIDQSGKSTQSKLLYEYLKDKKKKVILVREPGGTRVSEKVREILLDSSNVNMDLLTEFLLFSASRHQLTEEVIKPHLKKRYIVICDRYYDSSTAYQGHGGSIDLKVISAVNKIASGGLKPDLTFLINITYKKSLERRSSDIEDDRIEKRKKDFYNKVVKGYLEMAKKDRRFKILDGTGSITGIKNEIIKHFDHKLKTR